MLVRSMKQATTIAFLCGLAALVVLVAWQGVGDVAATVAQAGWGVLWLPVYFMFPLGCATAAWWVLFPRGRRPRVFFSVYATWVGIAVNWLLPVAQIGGELVKVHLAAKRGVPTEDGFASVMADKTMQVSSQIVYAALGVAAFASRYTRGDLIAGVVVGSLLIGGGAFVFYRLQRRGVFAMVAGFAGRFTARARDADLHADAARVDEAVRATYGRRTALAASFLLRMGFRVVLAGEILLAAHLLGYDLSLIDAIILESLIQAVRAGAFLIPGGIGAQEGAAVLVGTSVGLSPEVALAIALLKRARELGVGVPALLVWQVDQGRGLAGRSPVAAAKTEPRVDADGRG